MTQQTPTIFTIVFDDNNPYWSMNFNYNSIFLTAQLAYQNDRLKSMSFLTVNDVFDALGLERTREGMVYGWTSDEAINFGIDWIEGDRPSATIALMATNIYDRKSS